MSQRNIIICFIFVNVVVLVQSSNATPDGSTTENQGSTDPNGNESSTRDNQVTTELDGNACDDIGVGKSRYQPGRHGIYEKMSSEYDCAGRPAYQQIGSSNYIFYLSSGLWLIGPTRCIDLEGIRGIKAFSTAESPDKVTSTWEEYDGDAWVNTTSLDVSCSSLCGEVSVSNSRYQTGRHGIYEKMSNSDGCAGRPAYRQSDSSNYMFYLSSGIWAIGPTRCNAFGGIIAYSTAISPDKVTSTWEEYDRDRLRWFKTPSLDVSCDDTSSKASNSMRTYVWFVPAVVVSTIIPISLCV